MESQNTPVQAVGGVSDADGSLSCGAISASETPPTSAIVWYTAGLVAAVAVAWVAALIHRSGHAPVGIVSLCVGVALGVILGKLAAATHVHCRTRLMVGTLIIALLAVVAQHAWLYRDFRRQWHESRVKSAEVAMFRPESPWSPAEYFAHELTPKQAALWCLDAALVTAASIGIVLYMRRSSVHYNATRVASDAAKSPTSDH